MNKLSFILGLVLLGLAYTYPADEVLSLKVKGGKKPITDVEQLSDLTKEVTTHLQKLGEQEKGTFELIQLHANTATKQVVSGIIYDLLAEIKENDKTSNCSISLWEKPLENYVKFDLECGDEKRKYQYISQDPVTEAPTAIAFGAPSNLPSDRLPELHSKILPAFTQLKAENADFKFTLTRVLSATSQVVAGSAYKVSQEPWKSKAFIQPKC